MKGECKYYHKISELIEKCDLGLCAEHNVCCGSGECDDYEERED
jgi:hypothetical protein